MPRPNSERDITIQNTTARAKAMNNPGGNGVPQSICGSTCEEVKGAVCGKLCPFGSFQGPVTR